jgi:hypothetical protein
MQESARANDYIRARLCRGTKLAMMVRAPFIIPAPPSPETALPMINMVEDVATPHRREPSSNNPKNARNVHW